MFVVIRPFMHESSEDFPGAVGQFLVELRSGMFEMKLDAARKCAQSQDDMRRIPELRPTRNDF
eukprot:2557488-Karenia_brevis.AAC.1